MKRIIKVCIAGFGNVGQRFTRLLLEKHGYILDTYDTDVQITGIFGRSKGSAVNTQGLGIKRLLDDVERQGHFDKQSSDWFTGTVYELMEAAGADVFIELTTLSIIDGLPAADYIRAAFAGGMHVITANKGPEAWYFNELKQMALEHSVKYYYEATVMDGTPIFNLVEHTLKGCEISCITGILNSTSNYVLTLEEQGLSQEEAIKKAQSMGIAEADSSMDMDGWDGAAKLCSLANIVMNACITPKDVEVVSACTVTPEDMMMAADENKCIKYICRAKKNDPNGKVFASVKPEKISLKHPYGNVGNACAAVTLHTDLAGELTLIQMNPTQLQTAYGVYIDLITLIEETTAVRRGDGK